MKAYIFPGQGAQFTGMGKDVYESSSAAKNLFEDADNILGFKNTDTMFSGTEEELKQTKVTQPAIFLHSVILAITTQNGIAPDMVAGHSLGEFSALVANKSLSFEDGLRLVSKRADAMQKACEAEPSTMAAILGIRGYKVNSAGLNTHKNRADKRAIDYAKYENLNLSKHRPKTITNKLCSQADIILCCTRNHKLKILKLFPQYKDKVQSFITDVKDPHMLYGDDYKNIMQQIDNQVQNFLDFLEDPIQLSKKGFSELC